MPKHDHRLHAFLQLFHQAVELDVRNMNPGEDMR